MKIIFVKNEALKTPFSQEDRIELYPDTSWESSTQKPWDDFGYQTTFQMKLFFNNESYDLPLIKVLIEDEKDTHKVFKRILQENNAPYIQFPLTTTKYISLATDTEFYNTIHSLLEKAEIDNILSVLHDSSYIEHTSNFPELKHLMKTEGFYSSLLRDMTSKKALDYGWFIVDNRTLAKDAKFELYFQLNTYENIHKVEINFERTIFPNNMNILIGSNGTGKSQTLMYLIDELLGIGVTQQLNKIPVFNQIVAIAYSPFENYLTSLKNTDLKIKSAYKYFGFREENGTFNQKLPFKNAIESILKMLREDKVKDYFRSRPNKYDTFVEVISQAIEFDYIGFEIDRVSVDFQPFNDNKIIDNKYYMIKDKRDFLNEVHIYDEKIKLESGIVFFKDNKVIDLSSGQQIFSHLISNILGSIREDTILLIDEPELYLHPNLEVELIGMLKELLDTYSSYAVIATHSSIVVREVARDYISVLKRIENTIHISKPPFETFGGDMEKINSYVFFDNDKIKPHEQWLKKLADQEANIEVAIEKYKSVLNEESLILMYGMGKDNAN